MQTAIQSAAPLSVQLSDKTIADLVLGGDLSCLAPLQKVEYYRALCDRVGLDPATQPFTLMRLSGKEVLYCGRGGAAQLNQKHKVSHKIPSREMIGDIWVVTANASTPDGRCTESIGAVPVAGLKGEAMANAMMKAETKAKRRSTLDLLGLGMLDETEVETIPGSSPSPSWSAAQAIAKPLTLPPIPPPPKTVTSEVIDQRPWKEILGDKELIAMNYLVFQRWLRLGDGMDKLKEGHSARIRKNVPAFLMAIEKWMNTPEDATLAAAQKAVREVLGGNA